MMGHDPFGSTRKPCGSSSVVVDKMLGSSYQTVKEVADALPELRQLFAALDGASHVYVQVTTGALHNSTVDTVQVLPYPSGTVMADVLGYEVLGVLTTGRRFKYAMTSLAPDGVHVPIDGLAPASHKDMTYFLAITKEVTSALP